MEKKKKKQIAFFVDDDTKAELHALAALETKLSNNGIYTRATNIAKDALLKTIEDKKKMLLKKGLGTQFEQLVQYFKDQYASSTTGSFPKNVPIDWKQIKPLDTETLIQDIKNHSK